MVAMLPVPKPVRSAVPTFEPVTMLEAKRQVNLGADNSSFDAEIYNLISVARETVERDAAIVCCTGTYTFKRTHFPACDWFELASIRPITAVTSITYVDTAGATQTWSSASYALDTYTVCPIVKLAYNEVWPTVRGDINGITITATAGYSSQTTVPYQVKQACLLLISHWWENRGIVSIGSVSPDISMTYDALIDGLKWNSYS